MSRKRVVTARSPSPREPPESTLMDPHWATDIPAIAASHTTVAGVLAGFSVTVIALLAAGDTTTVLQARTLGAFVASFYTYVVVCVAYSIVVERRKEHRYFLFAVASALYYHAVVMSFAGLYSLFRAKAFAFGANLATMILCGALVGGSMAVAVPLRDLFRVSTGRLAVVFAAAFFAAGAASAIMPQGHRHWSLYGSIASTSVVFGVFMLTYFLPEGGRWWSTAAQLAVFISTCVAFCVAITLSLG